MSQLGWIALMFDPRGVGESEGPIECDCNPYHHAIDLAAWVGFVAALPQVDESNIFIAGVCAGALPAIYEIFQDKRVKGLGLIVPSIVGSETMGGKWAPVRWISYAIGGIVNSVASRYS